MVGSYVPDGVAVGRFVQETARGVTSFYDIDTPVTLAKLANGDHEYLSPALIPGYDIYFSFTGGPTLAFIEDRYGSPAARPLYCSVDETRYRRVETPLRYDLGYLGTYSPDRQPTVERLLVEPARRAPHLRFVVAGPQYPADLDWPANVERIDHVAPADHARFYSSCRFALNVTRADMIRAGYSPSVRLFEAAACGTPIVSDRWNGLDTVFRPSAEILLTETSDDVLAVLAAMPEPTRRSIAEAARTRTLREHTAGHRATELERHVREALRRRKASTRQPSSRSDVRTTSSL
jgi:spore maturation protein CgeB